MTATGIIQKITPQRKLLAIDGGGIRGMIAIGILEHLEALLKQHLGKTDDNFRLSDYFDYIAGTSTGAIIATCLSWGMSVEQIKTFYKNSGASMFDRAHLLKQFQYRYEDEALAARLKAEFGDATLGSDSLKTLLLMVMRNATTDSPWPLSNNPNAHYNDRTREDCNLDFPLWQLIRASTAAPTFFPPEVITLPGETNKDQSFVFVDGGITPFNNPAFQLFSMATAEPYHLQWETGEDNMLLVSIGTGNAPKANKNLNPGEMNLLYNATSIPSALMFASQNHQDFLCRLFGACQVGGQLDRELGTLIGAAGPTTEKLFTYMRYDAELTREGLNQLGLTNINVSHVQKMDSIQYIDDLLKIGDAVAQKHLSLEHYKAFLGS